MSTILKTSLALFLAPGKGVRIGEDIHIGNAGTIQTKLKIKAPETVGIVRDDAIFQKRRPSPWKAAKSNPPRNGNYVNFILYGSDVSTHGRYYNLDFLADDGSHYPLKDVKFWAHSYGLPWDYEEQTND